MNAPPMPYFGGIEDGKIVYWLGVTKIPGLWAEHEDAFERAKNWCQPHEPSTRYEDRQNGRYYFIQCSRCGKRLDPIKRDLIEDISSVQPFDFELRNRDIDRRLSEYARLKVLYQEKTDEWNRNNQELLAEWWRYHHSHRRKAYDAYINSDKWKVLRKQVLRRDSYTCQVCKSQRAVQVHHLTYEHFQNEPLEDLLSVCLECHEQIHGRPLTR